jgi:hypothetical protein
MSVGGVGGDYKSAGDIRVRSLIPPEVAKVRAATLEVDKASGSSGDDEEKEENEEEGKQERKLDLLKIEPGGDSNDRCEWLHLISDYFNIF